MLPCLSQYFFKYIKISESIGNYFSEFSDHCSFITPPGLMRVETILFEYSAL